jgi:two-component system response regulator YesN
VIRKIIGYMHKHYTDPMLSMSAIADAYGISAVRLSLDFKELSGMTPSEYLFLLRMEKAKELLSGTKMPVKDIGLAVGYYDASGFIRRFRQHMAMTPAQYRQMIGPKEDKAAGVAES